MAAEREPPRLQKRNVEVLDSDGSVIAGTSVVSQHRFRLLETVPSAGFWQYGTLQWDEFYRYMIEFVVTATDWTI